MDFARVQFHRTSDYLSLWQKSQQDPNWLLFLAKSDENSWTTVLRCIKRLAFEIDGKISSNCCNKNLFNLVKATVKPCKSF